MSARKKSGFSLHRSQTLILQLLTSSDIFLRALYSLCPHGASQEAKAGAFAYAAAAGRELCGISLHLTQIPKFGIVLVVVLVLGALGSRDRKETDGTDLFC